MAALELYFLRDELTYLEFAWILVIRHFLLVARLKL